MRAAIVLLLLAGCAAPAVPYTAHEPRQITETLSAEVWLAADQDFTRLRAGCPGGGDAVAIEDVAAFTCLDDHGFVRFIAFRLSLCDGPERMASLFCHEFAHVAGWRHPPH